MGRRIVEDRRVERLIQKHLSQGFVLLDNNKSCPACHNSLVRQPKKQSDDNAASATSRRHHHHHHRNNNTIADDDDSQESSWPIRGIAYCVKCDAHVVSQLSEVNILDAYEKRQTNTSLFVSSQTSNEDASSTGDRRRSLGLLGGSRSNNNTTKPQQQQQPTVKNASSHHVQRPVLAKPYYTTTVPLVGSETRYRQQQQQQTTAGSDSSGILEDFSLSDSVPIKNAQHQQQQQQPPVMNSSNNNNNGSKATIVRTEPSIRGSLIVDPILPESYDHYDRRYYQHHQYEQHHHHHHQPVVLLPSTPTLVEQATQTAPTRPSPPLWERQQEQVRRVLQARGGGGRTMLVTTNTTTAKSPAAVETTSEASAMSGRRTIPVQEGLVLAAKPPGSSSYQQQQQQQQYVEKSVYVVDGTDVASASIKSDQSSIASQRTSKESVVMMAVRSRDPPLAGSIINSWQRDDESLIPSLATQSHNNNSVKDPPSCRIVAVNSYHEQHAEKATISRLLLYGQSKLARDPSEHPPSQTDPPPIPKPSNNAEVRDDEVDYSEQQQQQQRTFVAPETITGYNHTVKDTLQKPPLSYQERPTRKPVAPATSFDSFEPIQEEKPGVPTTEQAEDNKDDHAGTEIAVEERDDDMLWSVADAAASLQEFATTAPRVSMHPRETLLTEQINAHNKDILRETERLEHLHKMKHDSQHHEATNNTEIHKEITKSIKSAIRAKTYSEAKVRQLQDERSKLEADRILSFLEEELREKQNEATLAEKLAKDAYERLNRAREKAMLAISAETIQLGETKPRHAADEVLAQHEIAHNKASQHMSLHEEEDDSTQAHSRGETTAFDERWELLREEGRSALTRRLMAGWRVSPHQCKGAECRNFPLLYHDGQSYCAVCAGTGSGQDGAYDISLLDESVAAQSKSSEESAKTKSVVDVQTSSLATKSLKAIQDEFDAKRKLASKEIGVRMRRGWMLLDLTCNTCMMPLLTDMFQECTLCVLCGVQSGHIERFVNEMKSNEPNKDAEPTRVHEKASTSADHADAKVDGSEKRGIRFQEKDHPESRDELSPEGTNQAPFDCTSGASFHSSTSAVISARSNRSDPPLARPYSYRRPISPDGRRQEERVMMDLGRARNDTDGRRSATEVIVVEDADSHMAEAASTSRYAPASHQTRASTRYKNTKHLSASYARRPTSPEYSVASAPQYGNPSSLVAVSNHSGSHKTTSRYEPHLASKMISDRSTVKHSDASSSSGAHSASNASGYSRNGKQEQDWSGRSMSGRSVGSSRSHTYRASSPGLSAARLPSAASTVYTGSSRVQKSILHTHRPRMYPEKWAGSEQQHASTNSASRAAPHRPQTKTTSFRPIRPSHGSRSSAADVIDVEPMRRWEVGREDVILVGSRKGRDRQHEEKGLEDLLRRIEKTKSQLEERSQASASKDGRLKGLVENLVRSAQQLREIENRS